MQKPQGEIWARELRLCWLCSSSYQSGHRVELCRYQAGSHRKCVGRGLKGKLGAGMNAQWRELLWGVEGEEACLICLFAFNLFQLFREGKHQSCQRQTTYMRSNLNRLWATTSQKGDMWDSKDGEEWSSIKLSHCPKDGLNSFHRNQMSPLKGTTQEQPDSSNSLSGLGKEAH